MMKKRFWSVTMLGLLAVGMLAVRPAAADSVLYSSGAPSLAPDAFGYYNMNGGAEPSLMSTSIATTFTLTGNSSITGFDLDTEFYEVGDSLTSLYWQIGQSGSGTIASGTIGNFLASPTSYIDRTDGYNLWEESGSITPLTLGAGSYTLSFGNAQTALGADVAWALTDNWTSASMVSDGTYLPTTAFQVNGSALSAPTAVTPEPGSFMLLGTGIVVLAGAFRRKLLA